MDTRRIVVLWNERGVLLDVVRKAIIEAHKNQQPLPEEIADMFTYTVYEAANETRLIPKFI